MVSACCHAACAAAPFGYEFKPRKDRNGADIGDCNEVGARSIAQLAEECNRNPSCLSFNLWSCSCGDLRVCFKTALQPLSEGSSFGNNVCEGIFVRGGQDCCTLHPNCCWGLSEAGWR